jgi:hypothetical protein
MTLRSEARSVVQGPDAAISPGAPGARPRAPDRRFLERPRSGTPTNQRAPRRQGPPPSQTAPPDAGVEQRHDVTVVTPVGTLPDPLPAGLVGQLEASLAVRPVIVDLSQITLCRPRR